MDVENQLTMGAEPARSGPAGITPATVAGDNPVAEMSVIAEQQWRASVSEPWQPYRRELPALRLLDVHRDWLLERAPQVHYSVRILYQELTHERGFPGCYETVKPAVRPLRAEAALAGLTPRRTTQAAVTRDEVEVRDLGLYEHVATTGATALSEVA